MSTFGEFAIVRVFLKKLNQNFVSDRQRSLHFASLMMFDRFQDHRIYHIRSNRTEGTFTSRRSPVPRPDGQTRRLQMIENETENFQVKHTILEFGNRLKNMRIGKELSQRDFALRASVKVDMIRDYENGRGIPNSQLIRCFESILGGSLR
jgi:ribosome-binding protein aMBF1 (putative translation factor)